MLSDYHAALLLKSSALILFLLATFELIYAVYLDLTTAKFSNKVFLIYFALNLLSVFVLRGFGGLGVSLITMSVAFLVLAPIYFVGMLGGGDIKLLFALSPFLLLNEFLGFLLISFVWAGIFGLLRSGLNGNLKALLVNTFLVGRRITLAQETMPFTIGMLLAWLSHKSFVSLVL